jgi:hypothetical protein
MASAVRGDISVKKKINQGKDRAEQSIPADGKNAAPDFSR